MTRDSSGANETEKKKPEPQTHEKNENQNELMRATYYYVQQYIIAFMHNTHLRLTLKFTVHVITAKQQHSL